MFHRAILDLCLPLLCCDCSPACGDAIGKAVEGIVRDFRLVKRRCRRSNAQCTLLFSGSHCHQYTLESWLLRPSWPRTSDLDPLSLVVRPIMARGLFFAYLGSFPETSLRVPVSVGLPQREPEMAQLLSHCSTSSCGTVVRMGNDCAGAGSGCRAQR